LSPRQRKEGKRHGKSEQVRLDKRRGQKRETLRPFKVVMFGLRSDSRKKVQ
jgi:hypothetical protein